MADYIVLLKQVPDVTAVSGNAFDENGLLKRASLPLVVNELDKCALAFAKKMQKLSGDENSRIIALTMGPHAASEVLVYAMSRCADLGCLLSDVKFGGSDTWATAHLLSLAIKKLVEQGICRGDYCVVAGMQSCDGDTAQVPPQLAAKLDVPIVPYAVDAAFDNEGFVFKTIDYQGNRNVRVIGGSFVVTVAAFENTLYPSFSRTRWAMHQQILTYSAGDIAFEDTGIKISKTRVVKIFAPEPTKRKRVKVENTKALAEIILKIISSQGHCSGQTGINCAQSDDVAAGKIWVVCCSFNGQISQASLELTGKAAALAGSGGRSCEVVLIGNNCAHCAEQFIAGGASIVYLAQDEAFAVFDPVVYSVHISALMAKYKPDAAIFEAGAAGRVIAPMVAMRTGNGLTADCTSLEICTGGDSAMAGKLLQTRPALGGNIMATIISQNSAVEMATVRAGVFPLLKPDTTRKGEVVIVDDKPASASLKVVSTDHTGDKLDLSADIIVSGGAGLKTKADYEQYVCGLVDAIKAKTVLRVERGASRLAVELGLASRQYQIGQTGTTVRPELYIAIGISGAVQHIVGISGSCVIIAINEDPSAPIVEHSDYYMIGQAQQLVSSLISELEG